MLFANVFFHLVFALAFVGLAVYVVRKTEEKREANANFELLIECVTRGNCSKKEAWQLFVLLQERGRAVQVGGALTTREAFFSQLKAAPSDATYLVSVEGQTWLLKPQF